MHSFGLLRMIFQLVCLGGLLDHFLEHSPVHTIIEPFPKGPAEIVRGSEVVLPISIRDFREASEGASDRVFDQSRNRSGQCLAATDDALVIALAQVCLLQVLDDFPTLNIPPFLWQIVQPGEFKQISRYESLQGWRIGWLIPLRGKRRSISGETARFTKFADLSIGIVVGQDIEKSRCLCRRPGLQSYWQDEEEQVVYAKEIIGQNRI